MKIIVPDTGVLIDGRVSELVAREKDERIKVCVSHSSVAELEFQANSGREIGFAGLAELKRLSKLAREGIVELEFSGSRPNSFEIERAKFGEIDAKIRDLAASLGATLFTTDKVQREVAEAEGVRVVYLEPVHAEISLSLEKFFGKSVLSVHLKENCRPKAKVGLPGEFILQDIGEKELSRKEIEAMVREAVEFTKRRPNSFIEIDREGATVLQVGDYRITFTKPPFSEAAEATIVKPLVKLSLSDYHLSDRLYARLDAAAEGVIVAGPPGSGKSTFVSALAEHYARKGNIVKTLEQPRDLQVGKEITQYAPLEGSFESAADILLLVRPDYTLFDEVRKTEHFGLFADLRMAGVGMIGVVHASKPIDAIQRFIGRVELGVIPQIIDTILFVEKGGVSKVFELSFTVRTPTGMREEDLARPVIEVRDFESKQLEFEIYKWGDEAVVFPLSSARLSQTRPQRPSRDDFKWKKRKRR
ncbi:MAG: ATPase, T2SS/T4P/T4SS family [Candidatus Micrarchaeota archaeon]